MHYNFDTIINRRNSLSKKWQKYRDNEVIAMSVADMEFSAPPSILNALKSEIEHGILGYSLYQFELKTIVVDYIKREYNWSINEEDIIWLPSVVAGMNISCRLFMNQHQPIITATPVYPPFLQTAINAGCSLLEIPLVYSNDSWHWDFYSLKQQLIANKVNGGILLLCNPHNPTGKIYTQAELEELLMIAREYNLLICSDEIHCDLILNKNLHHIPVATINEFAKNHSITLMSPAKTYNIPGLSCAFAVIQNSELRYKFESFMAGLYPQLNIMGLIACKIALTQCSEWKAQLLDYLRYNHDLAFNALSKLPGFQLSKAEATYLLWIDVRDFCLKYQVNDPFLFFEEAGVALGNGGDFGLNGFVRLNFACPRSQLEEALTRINNAVKLMSS